MWKKYKNVSTKVGGYRYDSKLEAGDALWLTSLVQKKLIRNLERQVKVDLWCNGVKLRHYLVVDFRFQIGKTTVLMETKGFPTDAWKIKKEVLMTALPPHTVYVVNPTEHDLRSLA